MIFIICILCWCLTIETMGYKYQANNWLTIVKAWNITCKMYKILVDYSKHTHYQEFMNMIYVLAYQHSPYVYCVSVKTLKCIIAYCKMKRILDNHQLSESFSRVDPWRVDRRCYSNVDRRLPTITFYYRPTSSHLSLISASVSRINVFICAASDFLDE